MADRAEHRAVCPAQEIVERLAEDLLDDMPVGWSFTLAIYPNDCHMNPSEPHVHYVFSSRSKDVNDEERLNAQADSQAALSLIMRRMAT